MAFLVFGFIFCVNFFAIKLIKYVETCTYLKKCHRFLVLVSQNMIKLGAINKKVCNHSPAWFPVACNSPLMGQNYQSEYSNREGGWGNNNKVFVYAVVLKAEDNYEQNRQHT